MSDLTREATRHFGTTTSGGFQVSEVQMSSADEDDTTEQVDVCLSYMSHVVLRCFCHPAGKPNATPTANIPQGC